MSFTIPILPAIRARVTADIERHTGKKASSRGDVYYPLAQAHAGVAYGLHKHLEYNADQLHDETSDDEHLLLRAAEMGIFQIAAQRAAGSVTVKTNVGAVITENSLLEKGDLAYRVTSVVTADSDTTVLQLRAEKPGADYNLEAGVKLNLSKTLEGVDTVATIVEMAGGADIEPVSRVRERLRERRRNPPQGGNENDYVQWAKAAHSDVSRAWCYSNENGPGTVVVRFLTGRLPGVIPTQAHIDAVFNHIEAERPAGMAGFSVGNLTEKRLNLTFTKLVPNIPEVRAQVQAELLDLLDRVAKPGGTILLSEIREAISSAAGERDFVITLSSDFTSNNDQLVVLGLINWPEA